MVTIASAFRAGDGIPSPTQAIVLRVYINLPIHIHTIFLPFEEVCIRDPLASSERVRGRIETYVLILFQKYPTHTESRARAFGRTMMMWIRPWFSRAFVLSPPSHGRPTRPASRLASSPASRLLLGSRAGVPAYPWRPGDGGWLHRRAQEGPHLPGGVLRQDGPHRGSPREV